MSEVYAVDPVAMLSAGLRLQALGDAVAVVRGRLGRALDAEGVCWGDDETGRAFDEAYRPAADMMHATLARAGDRLGEIGAAVEAVATVAAAADDGATHRLS